MKIRSRKLATLVAVMPAVFLPCGFLLLNAHRPALLFGMGSGFWGITLMLVMILVMGALLGVACATVRAGNTAGHE